MYNRDSKIMRKLLGKAAPDSTSGDPNGPSITSAPASSSLPTAFRPSKSQDGVYAAGVPILCLDVSSDRRAAVLGGAHILKTVVLDDPHGFNFDFHDGVDLRSMITAQPPKGNTGADQLSIRDVKWQDASNILTACANGKIFSYDLSRIGSGTTQPLEYIQIQEDSRQINTLDVNPHLKSWLLTGSQDGTARVFDISAPQHSRNGVTFRQRFAPLKCIDSVRQVKWSPRLGHEFACCTEGGVVLKWDIRQPARPLLRINAHEKSCSSISWHPDGNHLMSSGWDSKLHVWDLGTNADKRQKPKYTISTPAPVYTIAWRPGLWSATAQSKRVAQVAVSYDNRRHGTAAVHIWDLARPTMPYKVIERFDASPSALLWQDQDMLWTVGHDGLFNQCDVAYAPKVIDRQSTSAMAFSPKGDVLMFLDERPHTQRLRPPVSHHAEIIPRGNYGSSPNTPMLSISRSDSEEDIIGSFLGPRRRLSRKRHPGARSGSNVSTTPPSGSGFPEDGKQVLGLDQAIKVTGTFKSQQAMASGTIPAAKTTHVYQYLSAIYLETLQRELPHREGGKTLDKRIATIMEDYARAAESVSLFRLSQTWRILAYAVGLLLKRRAQYHLELRLGRFQKVKIEGKKATSRSNSLDIYNTDPGYGDGTPRRTSRQLSLGGRSLGSRSLLAEEFESTSNVPTPLARPADDGTNHDENVQHLGRRLEAVAEADDFTLGSPVQGSYSESPRRRLNSVPISDTSHDSDYSHMSNTEGYDFYDMDALTKAIDFPSPKNKVPRPLDYASPSSPEVQRIPRLDSDEKFAQIFSTSDGSREPATRKPTTNRGTWKSSLARHASDDKGTDEYNSRIRGEEIDTSSDHPRNAPKRPRLPGSDLPEEVFMISQTTMGTDETYPSQDSMPSPTKRNPEFHDHTPINESINLVPATLPSRAASPVKVPSSAQQDVRPHVIDTDYLPWDDDPQYPHPNATTGTKTTTSPLDPYNLITRALNFESRTSALHASAMILLLKPLVPSSVIDFFQANAILRQHHSRLMRMSLFIEGALLRNLCIQGWPEGLPEWGENYSALFTPAQQGVKVGFLCSSCKKPRELDPKDGASAIWTCERCKNAMAPCAVCGHREPELPSFTPDEITGTADAEAKAWLSEWWYCPGCSHGGHASCLQSWHAPLDTPAENGTSSTYSDGCCPLDGCGHACLPGKYRGETTTARADELGRAAVEKSRAREERANSCSSRRSSPRPGPDRSVKSDGTDVPQSRAVGMAREALNKSGSSGGGILSSSPGRAVGTGERERRKSVKFAATDR